jgi:FMN reductase
MTGQAKRVLGIVGSVHNDGRTSAAVDWVLRSCRSAGHEALTISVGDYDLKWADGTRSDDQTGSTFELLEALNDADGFVIGTPVYRATYTGALKNLLDLVPRGGYDGTAAPLRAKPVAVIATGATPHHHLAMNDLVSMLSGFFACYVVPPPLYLHREQFDDGEVTDAQARSQLSQVGAALGELTALVRANPALSAVTPQI